MTKEQLKIYGNPSQKMNTIIEIHQQIKEIFKNFQFNNEKDCNIPQTYDKYKRVLKGSRLVFLGIALKK
ncbi:hypothetical protein [Spiroplasma endosymbiont of 'Nebria riversi']|uniref:hypothetical protein n=1 Tax=Spiroplasma endosymbiont of 'Nebria riversi' TaxID=2792084 RepID=UPI001C03C888|nr:hypothetical protein [Spiroplasma endosymbiont of 'Nebria riversi']